ncbi:protein artichoke-like [Ornithodoros turicata]|uniref:protein artichoke-like n=1 Tax=Ornithodoros turicata TaxID=34597 RepID=UPI003138CBD4
MDERQMSKGSRRASALHRLQLLRLLCILHGCAIGAAQESRFTATPCPKLFPNMNPSLRPCSCYVINAPESGTGVSCDRVTFQGNFPLLPYRQNVHRFSQRHAGLQDLEAQLFTASDIPLKVADFSHNRIRRITERVLEGVEDTLEELYLGSNLLGDQLSPVFASNELRRLRELRFLDLSRNMLLGIDSAVFKELDKLEVLRLDGNLFQTVPSSSLADLPNLSWLSLDNNRIVYIPREGFPPLPSLQALNLTRNKILGIEDGAFIGLSGLQSLYLADNRLKALPAGAFEGLERLTVMDLSNNAMSHIPTTSLRRLPTLRRLHMRANKIRSLNGAPPSDVLSLEFLDLSRNEISQIEPGTFDGMSELKELRLDVNLIRKVEGSVLRGLKSLETISLNDNQLLVFPSGLLKSLPSLQALSVDYNRIAVLSPAVVSPAPNLKQLSLSYNLITDVPDGTFRGFDSLETLSLRGNKITRLNSGSLVGLQDTLLALDLGGNSIETEFPELHFPNLRILNLGGNKLSSIPPDALSSLHKLERLDLSSNRIVEMSSGVFGTLRNLKSLKLSGNLLSQIPSGILVNFADLEELELQGNAIQEIAPFAFSNLTTLETLDISENMLSVIKAKAFDNLNKLKRLELRKNSLSSFKADLFTKETNIEEIDLSHNQIAYLYPDSFAVHRRVRRLDISNNKLSFFPNEIIRSFWTLGHLNLAFNKLHTLEDDDFSNLPNLKYLDLSNNQINAVGERVFQNTTQLRVIKLQHNQISQLGDHLFQGISQLSLDLSYNHLSALPSDVFSRMRDFKLESINLAYNQFSNFPTAALKKQYSFLERANFSGNSIRDLPSNADVLVNIKELDMSHNPMSINAHHVLLGEPKSVRKLHLVNTGIRSLPLIESPFLRVLNISMNTIKGLVPQTFQKTTFLDTLDMSFNEIPNLGSSVKMAWENLKLLRRLDLSGNPISFIVKGDLDSWKSLDELHLRDLPRLNHLECDAFMPLTTLSKLDIYGYPNLQTLQARTCLRSFESLQSLGIEIKDRILKDQLQKTFNPRMTKLHVTGREVGSLSSSAFAGIRSPKFEITLANTSISDLPTMIFLPLPLSTEVVLNAGSNAIQSISPQLLAAIDSKQSVLKVDGIQDNPITCDCNLLPFWRWINEGKTLQDRHHSDNPLKEVVCVYPEHLAGIAVKSLRAEDLVCNDNTSSLRKTTSPVNAGTDRPFTTPNNILRRTTPYKKEPDIIFEVPTTVKPRLATSQSALTKVDTMIIGIVAGVVAFVCILIMVICIVRLRRSRPRYSSGAPPMGHAGPMKCTCLKPPPNSCTCFPPYAVPLSYHHPGHKMAGPPSVASRSVAYFGPYDSDMDHR